MGAAGTNPLKPFARISVLGKINYFESNIFFGGVGGGGVTKNPTRTILKLNIESVNIF